MFATKRKATIVSPAKPCVEALEDRCLLSGNVLQTNLVSDLPGVAQNLDTHLVNPWGISESPGSPFWISDNNAGVSSLYNSAGMPQALVVSIPGPGDPSSASGTPTGTVFNSDLAGGGFKISDGTTTAPAVFLFATEDGTILGWNPKVDPTGKFDGPGGASTHAVIAVDNSAKPDAADGAVYKGLTMATDANGQTLLYASNFRSGKVDVFDTKFNPVNVPGAFTDAKLPAGYAPFNVETFNSKIYVTYAKQNAARHDDVEGHGHGFVDVYDLDGSHGQRLISRGDLNSPWGLAIAPSSFGKFSGDLLVGNFGDGNINIYDPSSGKDLGRLKDPDGEPIQIDGLWALKVGNGKVGGDTDKVYFTAGIDHEQHGLFGSLTPVAQGTPEGPAEAQAVQIALDVFHITLTNVIQDFKAGVTGTPLQQDLQALDTAFVDLLRAERRFATDNHNHIGHSTDPTIDKDVLADILIDTFIERLARHKG